MPHAIAKERSITVTAEQRAFAVRNAQRYPWAAAERDAAVEAARPFLQQTDEALWDLVPGQQLPRSIHVFRVYQTNKIPLCPSCKRGIIPFGNYPWLSSVFARPWKIECPNCHATYPKNDFGAFYRSALDEHGIFRRGRGDRSLLFNAEHPDPKDPLHGFAVDDGYGWHEAGGERWDFVAVYTQWGLWGQIKAGIKSLADAYVRTNDAKYAHKCGVLLSRLADVYPEMDWHPLSKMEFSHSDGLGGKGRVEGDIWECFNGVDWSLAYDRTYDALIGDAELARFVGARHQAQALAAIATPAQVAAHIETGLIREIITGVKRGQVSGNEGMHQSALIAAALALDDPAETPALIRWAFQPGQESKDPAYAGWSKITGGNLSNVLVGTMDRDGLGNESAPGYAMWGSTLKTVADLLEDNPRYREISLYRDYPKYRRFFEATMRWTCLDAVTPPIGDSGGTGGWGIVSPGGPALLRAFAVYRDPALARHAVRVLGGSAAGVHGSAFEEDPERLRADVEAALRDAPPRTSTLMDGYGLAVLQTPQDKGGRALWMYFGRNTGHGHLDRLNLGLYAFNVDMLPDLGYPEFASGRPKDLAWTRNNAAHAVPTVNGVAQKASYTGQLRLFEPDGIARMVEVDSPGLYPDAAMVRRTAWLVDAGERNSYVVDIVRVRGGSRHTLCWPGPSDEASAPGLRLVRQSGGSYAGPDVAPEALGHEWSRLAGYSFLYDVDRDAAPPAQFAVDFPVKDLRGRIAAGSAPHLRVHSLTPLTEAAIAVGDPPQNRQNAPRKLRYLMLTRTGASLDTVFVSVLEPYDGKPFLQSVRLAPIAVGAAGSGAVAVEVTTADGRVDTIIATENPGVVSAGGVKLNGRHAFVARRGGVVETAKLVSGRALACGRFRITADADAYRGKVVAVDPAKPLDQRVRVAPVLPPVARVPGRVVSFANDGVQDAVFTARAYLPDGNVSFGAESLVRGFVDPNAHDRGLVTNTQVGQAFTVPAFVYVDRAGAPDQVRASNVRCRVVAPR